MANKVVFIKTELAEISLYFILQNKWKWILTTYQWAGSTHQYKGATRLLISHKSLWVNSIIPSWYILTHWSEASGLPVSLVLSRNLWVSWGQGSSYHHQCVHMFGVEVAAALENTPSGSQNVKSLFNQCHHFKKSVIKILFCWVRFTPGFGSYRIFQFQPHILSLSSKFWSRLGFSTAFHCWVQILPLFCLKPEASCHRLVVFS